ncbi:MAG: glutamine synthetase family protein [Candidatus Atabeyarchaeum deiterrae]|jgi:glutamine synthetase
MSESEIAKIVKKENVKEIALQFTDISGILHSLWVPSDLFPKVAEEGIHMDGSSVDMVDISESDLKLMPVVDTFVILPPNLFAQKMARVICDIYEPESDRPFEVDPRFVLKKVMEDSKESLGSTVKYNACSEIEYFLFKKGEDGSIKRYDEGGFLASPPADLGIDVRLEITENLRNSGITVEKHHHEVPPGKYELNLVYTDALRMADINYLVKFVVKMTAARKGLVASFMPKPFHDGYGCGLHTHVSLTDDEKSENLFYDPKGSYGLSKTALDFIAGILSHAKALVALTSSSVNSYKRLVPGWEAPVYLSWAKYNRSVLIRVPPGKEMRTRVEYRPTDGSCNFYTAFAGILAAGLDGIKRKIALPEPVEEDIYEMSEKQRTERGIEVLPGNLGEALSEFSEDKYLQDALGEAFSEKFLQLKTKEWKEFSFTVHEWERKKYLDV